MKYIQEQIAKDLYQGFMDSFQKSGTALNLNIHGAGVNWSCTLESGNRKCKVNCFEYRNYGEINPEYLISFEEENETISWGRTHEVQETIKSCEDWVNQMGLNELYIKYDFVDGLKRTIKGIESRLLENQPELEITVKRLTSEWGADLYHYDVSFEDRSCVLSGYGENEPISFKFCWDGRSLFEVKQNDLVKMSFALKRWLVDKVAPTDLAHELPWIEVGRLAKYYEKGEGIKGGFLESWDAMERFYRRLDRPFARSVLELIQQIRSKGFDESIRAGQSIFILILSRSRDHGLEENQKRLSFFFGDNEMKVKTELNEEFDFDKIEYSEKLEKLIQELEKVEID